MLFRRNSVTGAVRTIALNGQNIALNKDLHAN
jgi:hypothetical protein